MTIEEQCRDTTGYRFGVCLEWSHVRTPAFLASFLVLLGAAVEYGTWYARSAEFLQTSTMDTLRWLRMVGDSIFAVGIRALGWFVLGLVTGHAFDTRGQVVAGKAEVHSSM